MSTYTIQDVAALFLEPHELHARHFFVPHAEATIAEVMLD